MKESRSSYFIADLNLTDLNFVLSQIADRLDELEGRRGTPSFNSDVDMNGNKVTDAAAATDTGDVVTKDQVTGLTTDSISEGSTNLYYTDTRAKTFHDAIAGNHALLVQATDGGNGTTSSVSVASADAGAIYTVAEQGLINEIKGDVNTLVTDVNNAIGKLNTLLSNLRTAKIIV